MSTCSLNYTAHRCRTTVTRACAVPTFTFTSTGPLFHPSTFYLSTFHHARVRGLNLPTRGSGLIPSATTRRPTEDVPHAEAGRIVHELLATDHYTTVDFGELAPALHLQLVL
eukprot:5033827-Amphidinium_carterae.1